MIIRLLLTLLFLFASTITDATPYQLKKSLPVLQQILPKGGSVIYDIEQDVNGLIWVVAGEQLYSFDGTELIEQAIGLKVVEVYASVTENYLLLGTSDRGLFRYDIQTTELALIDYGGQGESLNVDSITEDVQRIYIGTLNGFYIFDKESHQSIDISPPSGVLGKQIKALAWVKDKLAVAYTPVNMSKKAGGVYMLDTNLNWSKNILPDSMISVWDIYFDEKNESLWLTSSNAGVLNISTIDNKLIREFNKQNGALESNAVLSIASKGDVIYAADFHNGLIKIHRDKVEYFKSNDFFPKNIDSPNMRELFLSPAANVMFVGLQSGGVVLIDVAEQGIEYFRESESNFAANNIWALTKLSDNSLALGVYGYGIQLQSANGESKLINLDPNGKSARRNHVKKIAQLNETELIVGTLGAGVLKVNLETGEVDPLFGNNQVVTDLLIDELGVVVTSLGGVQKWSWQGKLLFSYNKTDIVDSDKYFSAFSSKESLVLGTNGGILLMSYEGQPMRKVEGCGKATAHIVQLDKQRIAAATATGICIFSPTGEFFSNIDSRGIASIIWDRDKEELWGFGDEIIRHSFADKMTQKFDANTLQFIADKEAAAIAHPQGFLVASSNGLALINPTKMKNVLNSAKLIISNINTPLNSVTKGFTPRLPPLELASDNNSINLEMSSVNFRKNKFQLMFRLIPDNSEVPWTVSKSRFVSLNYLSPGEYQLQLKLSSEAQESVIQQTKVVVLPPWYLTYWAWTIYFTVAVIFLICIYLWRVRSINMRNSLLKEQVFVKTAELQNALQEKDSLFENVSHELKTPLTLILGRSEQLLKQVDSNTVTHNEIRHIEASADHLYQLVNQLLQLAEVKHQKQFKEPVDIISETKMLCESLSSLAQSSGSAITYKKNTASDTHWLELQQGAWSSILTNLVSNAVKYGDSAFGVNISLEVTEHDVMLTVSNKGQTIEAAKLQKIFNRFEQLDNNQPGQGLGLAIVKEIVTNHAGSVEATSLNNEIVFTVTIPNHENRIRQREVNQSLPISNKKVNNSAGQQRILVVEDNKELREFISSTLSNLFKVNTVEHGQAAIDWLENTKELPDLILSDVMMPVMNGYELCQTLKQAPEYQNIPLFLLTAKADPQSIRKGLSYAADDYIAKPFNTDVLITKIGNQLSTRAALKKHLKSSLLTSPEKSVSDRPSSDLDILLSKVNESLAENFSNADIKAIDIAKSLHMQEKTLNRKLQTLVGSSISELLREYRLNKAKQLLELGQKPKTVCFDCGFNSASYFGQNFKQHFGSTPSTYQKTIKCHK